MAAQLKYSKYETFSKRVLPVKKNKKKVQYRLDRMTATVNFFTLKK
jgi:hypothetical protein